MSETFKHHEFNGRQVEVSESIRPATEELESLLREALNELCAQLNTHDQDTIDYVGSLIERANKLGVNV